MKKRITFRAGLSVFALVLMTVLCLEAGYCAYSIVRHEETQQQLHAARARVSAVYETQQAQGEAFAAYLSRAVDGLRSLPTSWSDISAYSPAETMRLCAYQLQYLANRTPVLDTEAGIIQGPSGNETYYNLDMSFVVSRLQQAGIEGEYYVREDGVKMYGDYIMCAADFSLRPFGTIVQTSLGEGIVCDTGMFIYFDPYHIDIAASW